MAELIGGPFQNNFHFGAGSEQRMVWILNVQPVIPIHLTEEWNLITRTIMPIIHQPSLFPGADSASELGDINPTVFLFAGRNARFRAGLAAPLPDPVPVSELKSDSVIPEPEEMR